MAIQEKTLVDLGNDKEQKPQPIANSPYPGAKDFVPLSFYTPGTIIFHDNLLFRAKEYFRSVEDFNIEDWEQVAINSVSWGEISGQIENQEDLQNLFTYYQNQIDSTNTEHNALKSDFNAWIGRGGYLTAYDFETATPSQNDLTDRALLEITSISDPLQIWNGTKIVNLYNDDLWILTNTQDTEPVIFEWANQGNASISAFSLDTGGIIYGADPGVQGNGYIQAEDGRGKVIGWDTKADLELLKYTSSTLNIDTDIANLQATIDSLPKLINRPIVLRVAPGTTTNNITIERFYGCGQLTISCGSYVSGTWTAISAMNTQTHKINKLSIQYNTGLRYINIIGITATTATDNAFLLGGNSSYLTFNYCNTTVNANSYTGFLASECSSLISLTNVTISNRYTAVNSNRGSRIIVISGINGSGNNNVFYASGGIIQIRELGNISGTYMYGVDTGGLVIPPTGKVL